MGVATPSKLLATPQGVATNSLLTCTNVDNAFEFLMYAPFLLTVMSLTPYDGHLFKCSK